MNKYIIKTSNGKEIEVREVQSSLLEMAKDILPILEEHGINYWLDGGSALGAYRHQGFIPWDDDFDIAMMRNDYLKLIDVLEKYLDKDKYTFHCFEKYKEYNVLIPAMKIRKKNTFIEERNFLLRNKIKDCDGIFIDVFIYDYMNENKIFDFFARIKNYVLGPIIIFFENLNFNPYFLKKIFVNNAKRYGCKNHKSKYIGIDLCWIFKSITKPYKYLKSDIFPLKRMTFEDVEFNVAGNIEQYLLNTFGKNYNSLPPENKREAKHTKDIKL